MTQPRVTQYGVESIDGGGGGEARVTQHALEGLLDTTQAGTPPRVTQLAVEALIEEEYPSRVTQLAVEVLTLDPLHEREGNTTCLLWQISRRDGVVQRFAELDRDVTYAGHTWQAAAPFDAYAAEATQGTVPGQTELSGILSSSSLSAADLRNGVYDGARVTVLRVDWDQPARGAVVLAEGVLGRVRVGETAFSAEVRLPSALLDQQIIDAYTPECRVLLYSAACGVNAAAWTQSHTITSVQSSVRFTATGFTEAADWARYGTVTITSGPNNGAQRVVRAHLAGGVLEVWEPFAEPLTVGTTFTVTAGCDKRLATCRDKFNNVVNFRGFPHLPGEDRLYRTPDAR